MEANVAQSTPQDQQTPAITASYGTPMAAKRRAVFVQGGQALTLNMQMLDMSGVPSNLLLYNIGAQSGPAGSVKMRIRETVGDSTTPLYDLGDGTLGDPSLGTVSFAIPDAVAQNPGVYDGECAAINADGNVAFTNRVFVWVERGLFNSGNTPTSGPPSLDEVRLHLRDSDPVGNLLLDDNEWDLAEVCVAAAWGVRYWNEAQPPINVFYTTITFPYKHYWLDGMVGYLYSMAAAHYRRNHLAYQAGGVGVDDLNREESYMRIGQSKQAEFREWIKQKKAQLNAEAAFSSVGSSYQSYDFFP